MEGVEPAEVVEMEEERELYVAAMEGDVEFVQEAQNDEVLLRKTRQKYNLIHIATRYEQLEFIKALLEKLPNNYNLISDQENSYKNTPLHVAAEVGNLEIMRELYEYSRRTVDDRGDEGDRRKQPWLLKNSNGNTAVHVALIHGNVVVARFLLDAEFELAFIDNNERETPLHIAITQHVSRSESESMMDKMRKSFGEGGSGLSIESELKADNMSSMIEFLVEKASSVASVPDAKGVTPLHRAASLVTPYNLKIIRLIIKHCPQSVEVFDENGKSILHLLISKIASFEEGLKLLGVKPIYAMRNHQDKKGNTPLHIAAKRMDMIMVQVLLKCSAKMNIKNCVGESATTIIQQQNVFQMLRQRKFTDEESEAASSGNITYLRERMRSLGIYYFLQSIDSKGRNVLHKLLQIKKGQFIYVDEFVGFIEEVCEIYPVLVRQTDQNGDTPIHILVRNDKDTKVTLIEDGRPDEITTTLRGWGLWVDLLELCGNVIIRNDYDIIESSNMNNGTTSPWLMMNTDGNTPLHEAIRANNQCYLVMKLLEYDERPASLLNKRGETPLHLLAKSPADVDPLGRREIEHIVGANPAAATWPDEGGLTPILRAFVSGNITMAIVLCDIYPEAATITDPDGNSFAHLLMKHPSSYFLSRLLKNPQVRNNLFTMRDINGDTPMHVAIEAGRFDIIKLFLVDEWYSQRELSNLLELPNNAGKTPADLIADFPNLPRMENNSDLMKYLLEKGLRSSWGIPRSRLTYYMDSMNVIAALLTTITFTAAFTVPGGLIQDIGTPTLIRRIEFQVFMILDVIAMCLSMMVLICLLWIVTANNRRQLVRIQDFAVSLLLASFIATLFTFMAGVYATISPVKLRIAITTLVLCSILILLIPKFMVMGLIRLTKCFAAFFTKTRRRVTRWKL